MAHPRITSDPSVMMGKPCIKGTRITVEMILRLLGQKHTVADIIDAYPSLKEDDVHAAQAFAADFIAGGRILAAE